MVRTSLDSSAYYINREASWMAFNRRVLEEAQDEGNPVLERLKFLAISASNLDEFFEVRVAGLVQQIEDGYTEPGPDGLTLLEERDAVSQDTHDFVDNQYLCWNEKLRPMLAANGIRVLGLHELDAKARVFVADYCERELDLLLTPVTVDPAHPFPRVINKALCVAFLLRRRRRSSMTYTGVVTVPRSLPRLIRLPSEGTDDFIFLADLVAYHASQMYHGYDIVSSAALATAIYIWRRKNPATCWSRCGPNCTTGARATPSGWRSNPTLIRKSSNGCGRTSNWNRGRYFPSTGR